MKSSSLKKQPSLQDLRTAACELDVAGIPNSSSQHSSGNRFGGSRNGLDRMNKSKSMADLPRSGQPPKTTKEEDDDRVVELLEDSGVGSLRRVKRKLGEEGINVCIATIRQRALEKLKKIQEKAF